MTCPQLRDSVSTICHLFYIRNHQSKASFPETKMLDFLGCFKGLRFLIVPPASRWKKTPHFPSRRLSLAYFYREHDSPLLPLIWQALGLRVRLGVRGSPDQSPTQAAHCLSLGAAVSKGLLSTLIQHTSRRKRADCASCPLSFQAAGIHSDGRAWPGSGLCPLYLHPTKMVGRGWCRELWGSAIEGWAASCLHFQKSSIRAAYAMVFLGEGHFTWT